MADALATRISSRPESDATVRGIITGQTVIVLENGDVICGRLAPKSVRVNATRDPDGGANYDVEWQIEMGKVGT